MPQIHMKSRVLPVRIQTYTLERKPGNADVLIDKSHVLDVTVCGKAHAVQIVSGAIIIVKTVDIQLVARVSVESPQKRDESWIHVYKPGAVIVIFCP